MNNLKLLISSITFLLIFEKTGAQGTSSNIASFIPPGYETLNATTGNLNLDNITDIVLVAKKTGEDTATGEAPKRLVLLLIGQAGGGYNLAAKSNTAIMTHDEGGVSFSEPFTGVEINDGSFKIKHYGGMGLGQWSNDVTFKYSAEKSNWFLDKKEEHFIVISSPAPSDDSTQATADDPQLSISSDKEVIKTTKDFGIISFEKFDIFKEDK